MNTRFPLESKVSEYTRIGLEEYDNLDDVIFLRLPEVKAVTGLSKTSLYTLIRDNSFPAPVKLGPRAVAWVRSEVKQWAANRVLVSRSGAYPQNGKRMPHSVHPEAGASSKKSA